MRCLNLVTIISASSATLTDSTVSAIRACLKSITLGPKSLGKGIGNWNGTRPPQTTPEGNLGQWAEGIQTVLPVEGYPQLTRPKLLCTRTNQHITAEAIAGFIDTLEVNAK